MTTSSATAKALVPRSVTRFQCTGDRCPDTCCGGWTVAVDRPTYERLVALPAGPLRDRVLPALKTAADGPMPPNAHARISPAPGERFCPLLEEGWCGIHKALGEGALSDVCSTYPRSSRRLGGTLSQALTLSCPEAARLALLAPDAMELVEATVPLRPATALPLPLPAGLSAEQADTVRAACLSIVGDAGTAVWMRLAVLGLFCEQLTAVLAAGGGERLPAFLQAFDQALAGPDLLAALETVPARHADQALAFAPLLSTGLGGRPSDHQARVQTEVARGLGAADAEGRVNGEQLVAAYRRGVERLPKALEAAPHLWTNFLGNEVFREGFPFDAKTPSAHFLDLVVRFGVLRLMLAARCAGDALPGPEALVETVQVFCRRFQHDAEFLRAARATFHERGWDSTAQLFGLLRA